MADSEPSIIGTRSADEGDISASMRSRGITHVGASLHFPGRERAWMSRKLPTLTHSAVSKSKLFYQRRTVLFSCMIMIPLAVTKEIEKNEFSAQRRQRQPERNGEEINGGEHLALLALLLNKLKATQRHRILLDLSLSKLQVALLEIRIEYLG